MKIKFNALAALALLCASSAQATNVFINEIHYDNTGTDVGEFFEIAAPVGTNLTDWSVVLYNGNGGATYGSATDLATGTLVESGGYSFVAFSFPVNGLQNGSPDGLALIDNNGDVVQFLSYEGSFTATNGPASGLISEDIGVTEPGAIGESLQLSGSGSIYGEFTWQAPAPETPNALNNGQTFTTAVDTAPSVIASSPANGDTNVAIDANISLTFNEDVTLSATNPVSCATEASITVSISGSGNSYVIDPDSDLPAGDTCVFTVSAADVTDQDGEADNMAEDFSISFTVIDDTPPLPAGSVFFNEIHYDNFGTDVGEFFEIAAPIGTDLTGWSVVLYNGNGGATYGSATDLATGTLVEDGGYSFVAFSFPSNGLQNGAPDGLALIDSNGAVVQFLSYEGSFTASNGPASGIISEDIGVTEPGAIGDSLQLSGSGSVYSDFTWLAPDIETPNALNNAQIFTAPKDLFFSEYIEGSSNNKALEIYNPTGSSIDLAAGNYSIERYNNGRPLIDGPSGTLTLTGTILSGDVYVIANSSAVTAILDQADITSSITFFNGDDALVLSKDGVPIDSIGRVGEDPGSSWSNNGVSTQNSSIIRKSSISAGDPIVDDEFDPSVEWNGFPIDTFTNLGMHSLGGGDGGNGGGSEELGVCGDPATLISAVQGPADASPLIGETHVVEGIVTQVLSGTNGFFMQEEVNDNDGDPATSEGVFVFYSSNSALPEVAKVVRVIGIVEEFFNKTQLKVTEDALDCGQGTFQAATLHLPYANAEAVESLEGMYVSIGSTLTVTDNFNLGRFGEVTLSNGRLFNPTNVHAPSSQEALDLAASNALNRLTLDDDNNEQNRDPVIFPTGGLSASNTLRSGDQVSQLEGALDFSFSNYRIAPAIAPTFVASNPRPSEPDLTLGNLKVASLNVLNFFNTIDADIDICGPSGNSGCRGADDEGTDANGLTEFDRQKVKTIAAITTMDADILGLMEIENDGFDVNSSVVELVAGINAVMGENTYAIVENDGPIGTDAIAVALIYKPASVTLVGSPQILDSSNSISDGDGPLFNDQRNRPSLIQKFALVENSEEIVISVNHLKSKGSGCGAGDDSPTQGNCNLTRTRAAQALVAFLAEQFDDTPTLIIGDLNAYAKEDPIMAITDAGGPAYTDLANLFGGDQAYSYSFNGELGYLDYALASPSLVGKVVDTTEWHINADEPRILDYNLEFKSDQQQVDFFAPDAFRMSDHDPVIVSFDIQPPILGDIDGDGDVDFTDMVKLAALIRNGQISDLSYDYNNDGVVDRYDVIALRSMCTSPRCR